jgi:hypothetical protein
MFLYFCMCFPFPAELIQAALAVAMNPFNILSTSSRRSSTFRRDLLRAQHLFTGLTAPRCQATGQLGVDTGSIRAAHIIPVSAGFPLLNFIGIAPGEIDTVRNGLLLAKNIELAFDQLRLSFLPQNELDSNSLILKIWDPAVRFMPIWPENELLIGKFEGRALDFPNQSIPTRATATEKVSICSPVVLSISAAALASPCLRALCYQADKAREYAIVQGWVRGDEPMVARFGTPPRASLYEECLAAVSKQLYLQGLFENEEEDEEAIVSTMPHSTFSGIDFDFAMCLIFVIR